MEKNSSEPKLSVVMPIYNAEKYLAKAIESILNQTFNDFEFLIINDGSTDKSLEIINNYLDNRIKLISNESNRGLIYCLNLGLNIAKGEYIARMDADDFSLARRFEKQVNFLDNNQEIAGLGAQANFINENDKIIGWSGVEISKLMIKWGSFFGCQILHPTLMMRANIYKKYLYDNNYLHAEDYELWTRVLLDYDLVNLNERLLNYRQSSDSVSTRYNHLQKQNSFRAQLNYIKHHLVLKEKEKQALANEFLLKRSSFMDCWLRIYTFTRLYKKFFSKHRVTANDLRQINKFVWIYVWRHNVYQALRQIVKIFVCSR